MDYFLFDFSGVQFHYTMSQEYIHFFNEQRPAYSLNYLTPTQYRKLHYERISD